MSVAAKTSELAKVRLVRSRGMAEPGEIGVLAGKHMLDVSSNLVRRCLVGPLLFDSSVGVRKCS